jgi:[acyl-carrier-protein] S-malonyltransferase
MGKEFYDHYRCVQELFEEASNCLSINFVKLCFASSERELSKPCNAYLALFVIQAAIYTVLIEHGIEPSVSTGWGVGNSAAYYAAGVINFPDGLYLLGKYLSFLDELMSGRPTVTMRISGLTRSEFEQLLIQHHLSDSVVLAMIRSERDCIVLGTIPAISQLSNILQQKKITFVNEPLAYVLYLLCCHEMVERMNAYLVKIDCKPSRYPFLNHAGEYSVVGQPIVKSQLTSFMYEPIDVPKIVQCLTPCTKLIQMGPSFLTSATIKRYLPQAQVKVILQRKDLKGLVRI